MKTYSNSDNLILSLIQSFRRIINAPRKKVQKVRLCCDIIGLSGLLSGLLFSV